MIRKLLALDGVMAICHFRDDGQFIEGYGLTETSPAIGVAGSLCPDPT